MTKPLNQNSKENIYSLNGFGKVYRFTFKQTIKNKGFLLAAIMMILMMAMMKPLMYLLSRSGDKTSQGMEATLSSIEAEKLYILNETSFIMDKERAIPAIAGDGSAKSVKRENVTIYNLGEASEENLIAGLTAKDILVVIRPEANDYKMNGIISDSSEVSIRNLDRATEYVGKLFRDERSTQLSLDDSDLQSLGAGISTEGTMTAKEYTEEKEYTLTSAEYNGLAMGFALIIMVVASLASSYIISSVNEEKTSKLAETLLVSVRPMALLLGKVLGFRDFVKTAEVDKLNETMTAKLKEKDDVIAERDTKIKGYETASAKTRIARETGLSYEAIDYIQGSDEEAMKKSAEALKALIGSGKPAPPLGDPEPAPSSDPTKAAWSSFSKELSTE